MEKSTDYIAKPCGACCIVGVIHDGDPCGRFDDVGGINTYVTGPQKDKANGNILLYFADIFGMGTTNTLMMDSYASAGYLVLGLDYFQGDPISKHLKEDQTFQPNFDFETWKDKHMEFALGVVSSWVRDVTAKYGESSTRYACVGYCFGAPFVMNELAGDSVTAGAFAHPAFLKDDHFRDLKEPLFLSCAEKDVAFNAASRGRAIDILQSGGKDYHVQLFSGVEHGFALKGDITKRYQRRFPPISTTNQAFTKAVGFAKEQSHASIVSWLDFWLMQERFDVT